MRSSVPPSAVVAVVPLATSSAGCWVSGLAVAGPFFVVAGFLLLVDCLVLARPRLGGGGEGEGSAWGVSVICWLGLGIRKGVVQWARQAVFNGCRRWAGLCTSSTSTSSLVAFTLFLALTSTGFGTSSDF